MPDFTVVDKLTTVTHRCTIISPLDGRHIFLSLQKVSIMIKQIWLKKHIAAASNDNM